MSKKLLLSLVGCLCFIMTYAAPAKPQTLKSPDGRIVVTVNNFKYSIQADGTQVLAPSAISMTLADGTVYGGNAKLQRSIRKTVDETLKTPVYKKASIRNYYNSLTLVYKTFNLEFRAYNEGVAYRFVSKAEKRFTVQSEQAEFTFPDNWKMYTAYCNSTAKDPMEQLACSFENTYEHIAIKDWDKGKAAFLPVLVEVPNGFKVAITEADLFNFPGLNVYNGNASTTLTGVHANYPKDILQGGHNMLQGVIKSREDFIAKDCKAGRSFPWRIVQIAREDKELTNSDMVYKISTPPAADKDWSWVKPGKVAWDWWNDWNIRGVNFKSGVNNDTYKYYIDFASEHGIEYVILDEGWAVNKQADLMQVVPEINLYELTAYAKSKNVGLILWAGYWAVNRDMENVFLHYSMMGIKGFKIDFMDRDDQPMVDFYTACAEMGAKYKMMVDFHGAYKPTGLHRTYPNVINFEGVHGLEQMKWENSTKQVDYDVTIPFIRMMAGPFDYTQGAMRNATKGNYRPINSEPMSLGTRCRQLAEYIIFDAPLTMLCDSPSNYMAEPECTDFIARIPTVWDETIALDGKISEYVTMARRSGETWYVGSMTNWDERDLSINLSFLPMGKYTMELFRDGANANRCAMDYAKETVNVSSEGKTTWKAHMAPGGGWVAKIVKQ